MKGIWRYPWFWTALIAIVSYSDLRAFNGQWVYDDAGSTVKNPVVTGQLDWKEAFTRDFWGTDMDTVQSHKSFRPITTLTLKGNWMLGNLIKDYQQRDFTDEQKAKEAESNKQGLPPTLTFHLVNILLHGIVTGLVTKATSYILPPEDVVSQLVAGSLFGVHPLHAEVVSNITSRGEMLMSIFSMLAFLSFAKTRTYCQRRADLQHQRPSFVQKQEQQTNQQSLLLQRVWGIYVMPWLCMTLSLFSKEQGATTLISLVAWDFLKFHGNLLSFQRKLFLRVDEKKISENEEDQDDDDDDDDEKRAVVVVDSKAKRERAEAQQFIVRTMVLAVQTLVVVTWRYILNGESSPDFVVAQNPAAFAEDRFTRAFSVTWVYCLYIRDSFYPYYLSPDWSGLGIDLITHFKDPRAIFVVTLWYFAAHSFWTMLVGADTVDDTNLRKGSQKGKNQVAKKEQTRSNTYDLRWSETTLRQVNMAVWAFTFSPFLLSSNIIFVIGLMKADRVTYLPLFGFCLLETIVISKLRKGAITMRPAFQRPKEQLFWGAHFLLMFQLIVLSGLNHQRNLAWSDSLTLWETAYAVNSRSYHTMYNYGYELSLKQRFAESEVVMRPIGDPNVDGPSNTFVYAMVLNNLGQCDRALSLIDESFKITEQKRRSGGKRNSEDGIARIESNLLVARAFCTEDPQKRGEIFYQAVQKDQSNNYAMEMAVNYMKRMQQVEKLMQNTK
mmetsp:Transcript_5849/g.13586  ORF Transcript_5849/g.13586 Transcript_5849/m.13586 type:complete len:722 (-) Transcript_5849:2438-4603(-)